MQHDYPQALIAGNCEYSYYCLKNNDFNALASIYNMDLNRYDRYYREDLNSGKSDNIELIKNSLIKQYIKLDELVLGYLYKPNKKVIHITTTNTKLWLNKFNDITTLAINLGYLVRVGQLFVITKVNSEGTVNNCFPSLFIHLYLVNGVLHSTKSSNKNYYKVITGFN